MKAVILKHTNRLILIYQNLSMALSFKETKTKELHPGMNKRLYGARNSDDYH